MRKIKLPIGRWKSKESEPAWEITTARRKILSIQPPKYDIHVSGVPTGMVEVTDVYGTIISFPCAETEIIQCAATKVVKNSVIKWIRHPKDSFWINEEWVFRPTIITFGKSKPELLEQVLKENKCYFYERI